MQIQRNWIVAALLLLASSLAAAAPPLSGAIFTTDANGDVVNGNTIYADKCDVYLDGGPPPNAPPQAAGLPDGDYYFQVTDPSGKVLLSTDPVENRRITVTGGLITAHSGTHMTNPDSDHGSLGAIVVQLCPYLDTPNNGGVYKVWITPVGDGTIEGGGFVGDPTQVDNSCGNGCFHGFLPARSKTDNFKVGEQKATFCLDVYKQIAEYKKDLAPGVGWNIYITDPLGVTTTYATDAYGFLEVCGLTEGTYTVTESLFNSGTEYTVIFTEVNGNIIDPPTETVQIMWSNGQTDPQVVRFVNEEVPCDKKNCKK